MAQLDLAPSVRRTLLAILAEHAAGAEVWTYGSRAAGIAHEASDLDLAVRCTGDAAKQIARLQAALSESDLPIIVEVFDWARLPESFRREIERCHVVLVPPAQPVLRGA